MLLKHTILLLFPIDILIIRIRCSFRDFELDWCADNRMHLRLLSFAAFVDGVILTYSVHLQMKTYVVR